MTASCHLTMARHSCMYSRTLILETLCWKLEEEPKRDESAKNCMQRNFVTHTNKYRRTLRENLQVAPHCELPSQILQEMWGWRSKHQQCYKDTISNDSHSALWDRWRAGQLIRLQYGPSTLQFKTKSSETLSADKCLPSRSRSIWSMRPWKHPRPSI